MGQDAISKLVDDIIASKNVGTTDVEVLQQLKRDLTNKLLDYIDRAVIDALPDDKVAGLNALLDGGHGDMTIRKYIEDSGVDIRRVTLEAMLRFRDLYIKT